MTGNTIAEKMSEKRDEIAGMKKAVPYIKATNTVLDRKKAEKEELEAELQRIPKIRKKKRMELQTKIFGLNEEISDLTTEHNHLSHIAGSTVEAAENRIRAAEERLAEFENWENHLDEEIDAAISAYRDKTTEAANCNQDELRAERMKIRPQKYAEAYDSIEKQYWVCDMSLLQASQKNAAELLHEEPDERIVFPKSEPKTKQKQPTLSKHKDTIER